MLRGIADWLFDRSASCAALRGELSLCERLAAIRSEELTAARLGLKWSGEARGKVSRERAALQAERDGLIRELFMERLRNEDLRERMGLTDANAKVCFARLEKQQQEVRAWCERLIKEVAKEKQRRIEAEAELETLKAKGGSAS